MEIANQETEEAVEKNLSAEVSTTASDHLTVEMALNQICEGAGMLISGSDVSSTSCSEDSGNMRKLIECPVCLDIPLPPIFTCERGHIVCTDCQNKTLFCPLCRGYYCKTRSFIAEGIVEKCTLKCKYFEEGCSQTLKGLELVAHLKQCDFRPVYCVDCIRNENDLDENVVHYTRYIDHLINEHKINGAYALSGFVLYNMDLTRRIQDGVRYCWPPYFFTDKTPHGIPSDYNESASDRENTFLIRMHVTNSFVCTWVSYVGPQKDCSKFEVTIEFHVNVSRLSLELAGLDDKKQKFSLTWRGQANHFREDEDKHHNIFQLNYGLIIPVETVKEVGRISEVLSEWMYHVDIKDLTQSATKENSASASAGNGDGNTDSNNNLHEVADDDKPSCSRPLSATSSHLILIEEKGNIELQPNI